MRIHRFISHGRRVAGATLALLLVACGDTTVEPSLAGMPAARADLVSQSGSQAGNVNATIDWNVAATSLASRRTNVSARLYLYLSLAQLRAAQDADKITPRAPMTSAIATASAVVLESFFPADAAEIAALLAAQEAADSWPGNKREAWALGGSIGRGAASRVLAYAAGDRWGLTNPGLPPIGPGYWIYVSGPIARGGLGARPVFLSAGNEFRSAPPPAFGSPTYLAAVAEVRQISDTRTPQQLAIAQYWNVNQSPTSGAAMNNLAIDILRSYRRKEGESARILFLMNAATFDASIGCFDAKYAFWFLRPSMADAQITLPIGLPPHPSYPSAHSCVSGASTETLAIAFPAERRRVEAIALEASLSRLYGGIHYRFDMDAGLALGRAVARKASQAVLNNVAVR